MRSEALRWDGYDDAVIGYAMIKREGRYRHCLVYSLGLMLEVAKRQIHAEEGEDVSILAQEYVEHNILGAYIGPHTPIVVDQWV